VKPSMGFATVFAPLPPLQLVRRNATEMNMHIIRLIAFLFIFYLRFSEASLAGGHARRLRAVEQDYYPFLGG
jgi:hypothetical protein